MATKRPRGRPSLYTDALAAELLQRLSKGEPLANICRDDHMPGVSTVNDWVKRESRGRVLDDIPESFSESFARARSDGEEALLAQCLTIADTPLLGEEVTEKADGGEEIKRGDMLGHRKLQIETRLKLLAKWNPKKYGDKLGIDANVKAGVTVVAANGPKDEEL